MTKRIKIRPKRQPLDEAYIERIRREAYEMGYRKGHAEGALQRGAEETTRLTGGHMPSAASYDPNAVVNAIVELNNLDTHARAWRNGRAEYKRMVGSDVVVRYQQDDMRREIHIRFQIIRIVDRQRQSITVAVNIPREVLEYSEYVSYAIDAVHGLLRYLDCMYAIEIVAELFTVGLRRYIRNSEIDYQNLRQTLISELYRDDIVPEY